MRIQSINSYTREMKNVVDDRVDFLGKTYGVLSACIVIASVSCYYSLGLAFPQQHPFIILFLMIGLILAINTEKVRRSPAALPMLALFGAVSGASIAPLVEMVSAQSGNIVLSSFVTTAIIFVTLTGYVFYSKKDFSFLKGFLIVGLIGIIITGLLNFFFFNSTPLQTVMSGISVLLFSGFILMDTSEVINKYSNDEYIPAALSLYLDVFLIFQNLLVLFSNLSSDD